MSRYGSGTSPQGSPPYLNGHMEVSQVLLPGLRSRTDHITEATSYQATTSYESEKRPQRLIENEDSPMATNETLMATKVEDNGTIGCAFFSTQDNSLFIAEDVPLADAQTMQQFLEHIQPSAVLIPKKFPSKMIDVLDAFADRSYQEQTGQSTHIITLSNSDFAVAVSIDRLTGIFSNVTNEFQVVFHMRQTHHTIDRTTGSGLPIEESTYVRHLRLSAQLGSKSPTSAICAGALVGEVNKRRAAQSQRNISLAESKYEIIKLQKFHLFRHLYINPTAMSSLQILHCELHPNSQNWHTNSNAASKKEGLSVYGMFQHFVSTSQGSVELRKLFLRPSTDITTIMARHQTIAALLQPQNSEVLRQMASALRRVPNMTAVISKLSKGIDYTSVGSSSSGGLWLALERFSSNAVEVQRLAGSFAGCESAPILRKFRDTVQVTAISCVGSLVKNTIDFEQSKLRERYSIQSGIDSNLDHLKRRYDGMESFLTEVVSTIIGNSASWARQYIKSCIFLPQLGFLLVVELDESTGNGKYCGEGQANDSWEKVFAADGSVCYKTRQMKELDDTYGDIYCQIGDREVELLHQLASSVLEYSSELISASQLCGELDAVLALALGANKYGWNQPEMIENRNTMIIGGRHPLHETAPQHFIPNGFCEPVCMAKSKRKSGRILVITGPNHSGKSVYLKQVALIVYLAHVGSFIPADKAEIAITDKILVCMPAKESVSSNESAFATDLREVSHSIKQATKKSLVLCDEFGTGTCPANGAGLAAGLLNHFISLGWEHCPSIIMATHFHEIFEWNAFKSSQLLRFAHMKVEINHGVLRTGDDPLTYLFTLQSGRSSSSFGEQCATMNGVPDVVIDRASAISSVIDHEGDLAATCAALSQTEQTELENAEEVARRFISYDLGVWDSLDSIPGALDMLDNLLS